MKRDLSFYVLPLILLLSACGDVCSFSTQEVGTFNSDVPLTESCQYGGALETDPEILGQLPADFDFDSNQDIRDFF